MQRNEIYTRTDHDQGKDQTEAENSGLHKENLPWPRQGPDPLCSGSWSGACGASPSWGISPPDSTVYLGGRGHPAPQSTHLMSRSPVTTCQVINIKTMHVWPASQLPVTSKYFNYLLTFTEQVVTSHAVGESRHKMLSHTPLISRPSVMTGQSVSMYLMSKSSVMTG